MPRHTFAIDLLRPDIKTEELLDLLTRKQELTREDVRQINDAAHKIVNATAILLFQPEQ